MYDQGTAGNAVPLLYGTSFLVIIVALALWDWVWKAIGMWHAARRGEKVWFIVVLIFNTVGILPIAYLAFVAKIWSKSDSAGGAVSDVG